MATRALVTGGAGLIGSHVVDLLVNEGWKVRALDNLEPQTHRRGKPAWINKKAEFIHGDVRGHCAICRGTTTSGPAAEHAPRGGETVYGLTNVDQERLVLLWGKQLGIPAVALRCSCTYGPRHSIFNPYAGVIAILCTR